MTLCSLVRRKVAKGVKECRIEVQKTNGLRRDFISPSPVKLCRSNAATVAIGVAGVDPWCTPCPWAAISLPCSSPQHSPSLMAAAVLYGYNSCAVDFGPRNDSLCSLFYPRELLIRSYGFPFPLSFCDSLPCRGLICPLKSRQNACAERRQHRRTNGLASSPTH